MELKKMHGESNKQFACELGKNQQWSFGYENDDYEIWYKNVKRIKGFK